MNEDALVETMAREWKRNDSGVAGYPELKARRQLETLRAEGFEVYRPEDAPAVFWCDTHWSLEDIVDECEERAKRRVSAPCSITERRLVPVGEGTDDE